MSKVFITLFMIASTSASVYSQDSTAVKAKSDSLIKQNVVQNGKYANVFYTVNGAPLTESTLEERLMSYHPSAIELQQFQTVKKQSRTAGIICGSVCIAAAIAGTIQIKQQGNPTGSAFSNAPIFFSVSIAGLIGEIASFARKNDHFGKAIEAYNARF